MSQDTFPLLQQRWVACLNNSSSVAIPPYGLVRVVSIDSTGLLTVDQPNADGQDVYINGPQQIAASGYGSITRDWPTFAAYTVSDGTPANGETWGAGSGTYLLKKGKSGFMMEGAGLGGYVFVHGLPASGGTVTNTGGNLTNNYLIIGAGTNDTKVVPGITTDGTSKINLGVAGSSVGAIVFANATSGTITIQPPTGALGTPTLTLPITTTTLAGLAVAQTWTANQTFADGTLNLSGATSGTSTLKAPATGGGTITLPPGTDTLMGLAGGTFTGKVTFRASVTGGPSFNIQIGVRPTSPAAGDTYLTAVGLFIYSGTAWLQISSNLALEFVGTTTNTLVQVFSITDTNGLHGSFTLKNTDAANALSIKITATDLFGVTLSQTNGLVHGTATTFWFDGSNATSWATPPPSPYQTVKVEVVDGILNTHATYDCWLSSIG